MSQIRNIWDELGFTSNPFHTDALKATEQDHSLYIRRGELEAQLGTWLASEDRGGVFVEGAIGVGKTTFVNQTQYALQEHDEAILPCDDVVEIQNNTTAVDLLLSVVASILRALQDMRPNVAKNKGFQVVEEHVRRTRIATWGAGASLFGFGGDASKNVSTTHPTAVTLQSLQELLEQVQALIRQQKFDKVVVILNNLDNVQRGYLWGLLHDVRDTLLQRLGLVFVFIGPIGLRQDLSAEPAQRRISQVLAPTALTVASLSKSETWEVVEARVRHYAVRPKTPNPVPRRVVDTLYDASRGELRYILNRLGSIMQMVARTTGLRGAIDEGTAFAALGALIGQEIAARRLAPRKLEVLQALVVRHGAQPKEFKHFGFNSAAAFQPHLKEFAASGLVDREASSTDAREAIYRPRGDVVLFFSGGSPLQGDKDSLQDFIGSGSMPAGNWSERKDWRA